MPLLPLAQTTDEVGMESPLIEIFCPCSTMTTVWAKRLLKEKQKRQMMNIFFIDEITRLMQTLAPHAFDSASLALLNISERYKK
jgi:hypothetical protein